MSSTIEAAQAEIDRLRRIEMAARAVAITPSGNISGSKARPGNRDRLADRRAAYAALRTALEEKP